MNSSPRAVHIEKLPNGHYRAAVSVNGQRRSVTRRLKGEARYAGAELTIELGGKPTEAGSLMALGVCLECGRSRYAASP